MVAMLGVSATHLAALEAALGQRAPVVRDYGWLGHIPAAATAGVHYGGGSYGRGSYSGAVGASPIAGRMLVWSCRFRTDAIATVKAADVAAGKYDTQVNAFADAVAKLPPSAYGKHVLIFEHEMDAAGAQASGTIAELTAAITRCNRLARARAGFGAVARIGVSITGYQASTRAPLRATALADGDVILIDQPYMTTPTAPVSGDSLAGPAVDYLAKTYPTKPLMVGEWGSVPYASRSAWVTAFAAALKTARYARVEAACYWDDAASGIDTHLTGTVDQPALLAAIRTLSPQVLADRATLTAARAAAASAQVQAANTLATIDALLA